VHFICEFAVALTRDERVEFDHAQFVVGFFVLLLLVLHALCDACYDGDCDDAAAEEETQCG